MDDTSRLSAIQAIRTLKARYFRLQDNKIWDEYRELFLDDLTFDVSEAFHDFFGPAPDIDAARTEPIVGRDAIVAYVSGGLNERVRSFHEGFMPEIEILSEASARAIWPMEDKVWFLDGPVSLMHGHGYYHETYTRVDGRWHIQTLKITRIKVDFTSRAAEG